MRKQDVNLRSVCMKFSRRKVCRLIVWQVFAIMIKPQRISNWALHWRFPDRLQYIISFVNIAKHQVTFRTHKALLQWFVSRIWRSLYTKTWPCYIHQTPPKVLQSCPHHYHQNCIIQYLCVGGRPLSLFTFLCFVIIFLNKL